LKNDFEGWATGKGHSTPAHNKKDQEYVQTQAKVDAKVQISEKKEKITSPAYKQVLKEQAKENLEALVKPKEKAGNEHDADPKLAQQP
jgi:hypothetical protein